jgi:hypothetical protein
MNLFNVGALKNLKLESLTNNGVALYVAINDAY